MDAGVNAWFDDELAGSTFVDERLGKRLRQLVERLNGTMGASIPLACQDWANTKAAYRFFANDRVSEGDILAGHFQATRSRFAATTGPILVLQDTSDSSIKGSGPSRSGSPVGPTRARLTAPGRSRFADF